MGVADLGPHDRGWRSYHDFFERAVDLKGFLSAASVRVAVILVGQRSGRG